MLGSQYPQYFPNICYNFEIFDFLYLHILALFRENVKLVNFSNITVVNIQPIFDAAAIDEYRRFL